MQFSAWCPKSPDSRPCLVGEWVVLTSLNQLSWRRDIVDSKFLENNSSKHGLGYALLGGHVSLKSTLISEGLLQVKIDLTNDYLGFSPCYVLIISPCQEEEDKDPSGYFLPIRGIDTTRTWGMKLATLIWKYSRSWFQVNTVIWAVTTYASCQGIPPGPRLVNYRQSCSLRGHVEMADIVKIFILFSFI